MKVMPGRLIDRSRKGASVPKKRRVSKVHVPLGFSREAVISFRRFTTPEHRRSKRFRQIVVQPRLFAVREVAVALKPRPGRHNRRPGPDAPPKIRWAERAAFSLMMLTAGTMGSLYFGSHLETRPDLFLDSRPAPVRTASASPRKVAAVVGTGLSRHADLRDIRPVAAVSPVPAAKKPQPPSLPRAMPRSLPVSIRIPKIGLDTSILPVGLGPSGAIAMPEVFDRVGWYDKSPTPGERGPAVIVGHVDSPQNIAVFWRLRELLPGDTIRIGRQDGTTAVFKVSVIAQFTQDRFPTPSVYGNINYAGLRLITCGGTFNAATGHYDHNTVVYGRLQE